MSSSRVLNAFQLNLVDMCLKKGLVVWLHKPKEGVKWEYSTHDEGFSLTIQAGATTEENNIGCETVVIEAMTEEDYQALEKQLSGCLGIPELFDDGVLIWEESARPPPSHEHPANEDPVNILD